MSVHRGQTPILISRRGWTVRYASLAGLTLQGYLRLGYGWVKRDQADNMRRVRVPRGGA